MHVVAVLGVIALVILGLWVLTHVAGLWAVLSFSIGLGGSPGVQVEPAKGFHVQTPVSAPTGPVHVPAAAPAVSAETQRILDALAALDLRQQARDAKQDGRLDTIERRLDGLTAQQPSPAHGPDCSTGGPPRFGPPQTVSPR